MVEAGDRIQWRGSRCCIYLVEEVRYRWDDNSCGVVIKKISGSCTCSDGRGSTLKTGDHYFEPAEDPFVTFVRKTLEDEHHG